jgi:hypothetical protein
MKLEYVLVIVFLFCTGGIGLAMGTSTESRAVGGTNKYHVAFVDLKEGRDSTYIGGELQISLREMGIRGTYSDDADTDLHVICRFKHKLIWPEITQGATIVMTEIGKCSIKIIDKKTEKVLIEKSWVRGKKNGKLPDFIKTVFEEFKGELETNAVPQVLAGSVPKVTNSVPLSSASTATNGQAVK